MIFSVQCLTHEILPTIMLQSTAYVLNNKIVFLPQTDVKMTCVCPTLPDITHGTVTRPDVATVGSTTQYQCEPTHALNGPSIRTCQADGTWSGVEPTCDSEQMICECIITEVDLHSICLFSHNSYSELILCSQGGQGILLCQTHFIHFYSHH